MVFSVGETVVYPHHGAALIEAIETRVIKGEEKQYLVLRVAQGDLTVRVPAENAEIVGVREVVRRGRPGQGLRRPPRTAHRGADQLVAALQGQSREAGLR
jgi:RNA polymerase-interacting CarD/CdnL/TRCF family regulator